MDERLKERLTGAAILVLLVAWLLPEMFSGRAPAMPTAVSGAVESPPADTVVTFAITPETALEPELQPLTGSTAPVPPAAPPATPAAADTPAALPKPETAPASSPATKTPDNARPAEGARKPAVARAAGGGWVVQVGSFSERANAQRMVQQASRKGFKLQVAGPDDRGYFRVRSAVVRDRAAAASLQERLRNAGFKGVINSAP